MKRQDTISTAKRLIALSALGLALCASAEHCMYDSVSLDGAWEMAYRTNAWEGTECPSFRGAMVQKAVPGYWEDMRGQFAAAGIDDAFAVNPAYRKQTFPIKGSAYDTTLPDIYGTFLYRRTFSVENPGRAVVSFEGVRNEVSVWINGVFIASRQGFSTPFEMEIPNGVLKSEGNEIVLSVSNRPNVGHAGARVSGLSTRGLFESTGGVNGHMELRLLRNSIEKVYVTTAKDLCTFTVHVGGVGNAECPGFEYEIRDGASVLLHGQANGDVELPTEGFDFWSPERPRRYELVVKTPQGSFSQLFGLRRLSADGEGLRLNGKSVYLRGVTEHCYFADTVHIPRDIETYRAITARRKELGFNFVRFHTFIPPAEYFDATDELGMLVHVESPNFVTVDEYRSIVEFARRHPSVVIYCTGNETRIDRIAEAYLKEVSDIVHSQTDALFSPMSAMRGVEYMLVKGKDDIAGRPFKHNPRRMARIAPFCDLFNSYQLGATSYNSLNGPSAATIDKWGDAYCGKPRLSHEICIDGEYMDLSLEEKYPADSPIVKTGLFSGMRRHLAERGLLDRAATYHRNSCEWMRRIRKFTFEKMRASRRTAGYDFLGDINMHWHTFGYSVGMMDEFYRLKPGESVRNVLRYNSAAVLLSDLGSDFVVKSGERKRVAVSLSNFEDDATECSVKLRLAESGNACGKQGRVLWSEDRRVGDVKCGEICGLGTFEVEMPRVTSPVKLLLEAEFSGGVVKAENEWEIWVFPEVNDVKADTGVKVVDKISADELVSAMDKGETVLLFGAGPFKSLPTTYRIGLAGRCIGNYATVVKSGHPALAGLPHEGFCGWEFRRLMEGARAVQLEAGVPFDPIIDVASSDKFPIRQSLLFEYSVGRGRLLVCSLVFGGKDPAAEWLKARLTEYAGSDSFAPKTSITPAQLRAVIDAPLLTGQADGNRARNPNDPSSRVRSGRLAQP